MSDNPASTLYEQQKSLEDAFSWIREIYGQAYRMLNSIERWFADHKYKPLCSGPRYTSAQDSDWRFVWLDTQWFVPTDRKSKENEQALFVAFSYASDDSDHIGCFLHLGRCEFEAGESILSSSKKARSEAHKLLDYAIVNPHDDTKKRFSTSKSENFMTSTPTEETNKYGVSRLQGVRVPVAWFDSADKLNDALQALLAFGETNDGSKLVEIAASVNQQLLDQAPDSLEGE